MNKIIKTIFLIAIILLAKTGAKAQINFKEKQIIKDNYFAILNDNKSTTVTSRNENLVLNVITKYNKNFIFKLTSNYSDDLGFDHKKYCLFYNGIEVIGMDFVLHEKANQIKYLNGTFEDIVNPNLVASLSEHNATQSAKLFFKSKNNLINNNKIIIEDVGICLTKKVLNINSTYCLVYRFNVKSNFTDGIKI